MEKKFSAKALSYGFPRLDIDGEMLYDVSGDNKSVKHIVRLGHCTAATAR